MDLGDYQTAERMAVKFAAVPLPDLTGRTVLDVGCDHGAWCWRALELGASRVLGIDRGREVRGEGFVNLVERNRARGVAGAEFRELELGRQWHEVGRHDVVLMLNVYHHAYQAAGDHAPLWFWLWRHTAGELLWEAPLSTDDSVVARHVTRPYFASEIRAAADEWFDVEDVGPGWVPTRRVWRCRPKAWRETYCVTLKDGAGGAAPAFEYADGRRIAEIETALGVRPIAGSLNCRTDRPFHWDRGYYRAEVSDVVVRKAGLDSEWAPRWCRFYPVGDAYAMRFEGERYAVDFVELIAPRRLRDTLMDGDTIG